MASKSINIRWIGTGSHPYWKLCIASYYIQISTNIKIYNHKIKFFGVSGLKTGFNFVFVHFYIRGKLFKIQLLSLSEWMSNVMLKSWLWKFVKISCGGKKCQGSKGIRQLPMNWCATPKMIHKITLSVDYN